MNRLLSEFLDIMPRESYFEPRSGRTLSRVGEESNESLATDIPTRVKQKGRETINGVPNQNK